LHRRGGHAPAQNGDQKKAPEAQASLHNLRKLGCVPGLYFCRL
jgi:hypothetical protein